MPPSKADRIDTAIAGDTVTLQVFTSGSDPEPATVVEVSFALNAGVPTEVRAVRVQSTGAPLTPSALQRSPWASWLEIADAAIRWPRARTREGIERHMRRQEVAERALLGEPRRPGRRPLPDEHYRRVAERYLALRKEGKSPIAVIAAEERQNRNTVAGWVRKARERGYLPPGRPGRAG